MPKYHPNDLTELASALFAAGGMGEAHARRVAEVLVETDMLGHTSHGLAMLPRYMDEIDTPRMLGRGDPDVIADHGGMILWDGRMLPGHSLVTMAVESGLERLPEHGIVVLVVRRSHHTGGLVAYLRRATDRGAMMLLCSSNPGSGSVAPFGGKRAAYSTNPIACGIPGRGDPILIDLSLASVSANVCRQFAKEGRPLPGEWLLDPDGRPTNDPNVLDMKPRGSIMPLGGAELGYKGFALAMIIEAMTSGLAGYGRSSAPTNGEGSVFLMLIDPGRLGGGEHLAVEMRAFVERCRAASATGRPEDVRIPGERALANRRTALREGLEVPDRVLGPLRARAEASGVAFPAARG